MNSENTNTFQKPQNSEIATHPKPLMKWTITALPRDTLHMDIGMIAILLLGLIAILNGIYETYILLLPEREQSVFLSLHAGIVWSVMCIYLWTLVVRQKKIYKYTITNLSGTEESTLHFQKTAGTILKVISALFLASIIGFIVYNPSLILILAGPAGMALIAAKFFLRWDNTPHIEESSHWSEYNFVTIDRKRNIIVAQQSELMVGFEARPPKDLFEQYLQTLRQLLPKNAVFTECDWRW